MKYIWFKRTGWMYRPTSVVGWAVALVTILLCIQVFIAVDACPYSVSDTFMGYFFI